MPQSPPDLDSIPVVVTVAGLKKSGKTTVAEALISDLSSRGIAVGSIKTMADHLPSLSAEATDTRRHEEAGAQVVVALHAGGIARFERGTPSRSLREVARLFPRRIRILVCEGSLEPADGQHYIVCLRTPDGLEETLREKRIPRSAVVALAGAAGAAAAAGSGIPYFDVLDPAERKMLADLMLEKAGLAG
jgi:molybdopterin-guanine dinucleotide biosynthesis protein MobB